MESEIGLAMFFKLGDAQVDVFGFRRRKLPQQAAGEGENGQLDAVFQKLLQRLGGDLNVAEEHHLVDVFAGEFQQDVLHAQARGATGFFRSFAQNEPFARFAQDGVLVDEVEGGHGIK